MNDTATAAASIKIQGHNFTLGRAVPYTTGHPLTEVEASVLNQTWLENLRNNFAAKVKAALEKLPEHERTNPPEELLATLSTEFNTYASDYTFGHRAPRAHVDPVEHLARKLAKEAILTKLRERKIEVKSVAAEKMEEYINGYLNKYPETRKEAKRRLDVMRKSATSDLSDLGL